MKDENAEQGASRAPAPDRAQIEVTRARMSETIDEIEDALVRKKARIQDRMDFLAPVREQPMQSVGIALGAGLLLGLLTGGGKDRDAVETDGPDEEFWQRRSNEWESRARRLLQIAQEQEEDLESMANHWSDDHHVHRYEGGHSENGHSESGLSRFRDTVVENLSAYVSKAVEQMGR